jgi:hypothetical protein
MARSFDSTEFASALSSAGISIFALARRALTPMFRMRRILRGSVPIGERRLRIATVLADEIGETTAEDVIADVWPEA